MNKVIHILISLVLLGYGFIIGVERGSSEPLPSEYAFMPFDVNNQEKPPPNPNPPTPIFTQKEIYEFIWKTFIALNWPHKSNGSRGEPDTRKSLAPWNSTPESEGPVVWETYRRPDQVFLPPKEWPLSWDENRPPQICPKNRPIGLTEIPVNSTNYSENADGINQPYTQAHYPTGPALDQNKNYLRYEVTLNQSFFSYIKFFKYYRS